LEGTITVTTAGRVNVHTYVAPERGWRASSHLIELPGQVVLFDLPLTLDLAREVLDHATAIGKPISRWYISHAHPDHFTGATIADAPTYALRSQKELIDRSGDLRIARAYAPGTAGVV
jgi:glyoxylase-like metal-dependent hydrolase (beta-lactamase superfamily II)